MEPDNPTEPNNLTIQANDHAVEPRNPTIIKAEGIPGLSDLASVNQSVL